MAFVIREGDPTTTNGIVVAGSSSNTIENRKAARISDPVWCPSCKSMGYIAEGNPTVIDQYLALATHGHIVKCGCPYGSNRLIATQSTVMAAQEIPVGIAQDLALKAEAGSQVWASAINDGSYSSPFTAGIPPGEARGLTQRPNCVFAKTCTVPPDSTDAGTTIEPATNFGKVVVMGSTAFAYGGTGTTLGRIAGQASLEALGAWGIRGTVAAAGSVVSTLLLALWPSQIGDSTFSEEQLRSMTVAPTRVRFQFRKDESGVMRVYGIHTSASSGADSVPVAYAAWSPDRSVMEAELNGVTITWSPNDGPIASAPTTYPGVTDELANIMVHPVAEDTDSQIEVYPASDDVTWQDTILVFPADSGVPPIYLVFAKPMVKPLEVGICKDLRTRSKKDGLEIDHIPSQRVIQALIMQAFPGIKNKEVQYYLDMAPSIAIPTRVHRKYSETYGWNNTKTKQSLDAADPRAAVDSNFDAIKRGLLEEGFLESDIEVAREQLHKLCEEQGWY